jgi:G:T-mismatch repair DNA endonuclease (very short patch repair protein)
MKCIICNKEFYKNNVLKIHMNKDHDIDKMTNEKNYIKSLLNNNNDENIFNDVKNKYLDGFTVDDIKNEYGVNFSNYILLLNIKRTASESKKTKKYIDKVTSTNLKRYNVVNPSQSAEVKEKKKDTFLKNFGYENIFCNDKIRKNAITKIDYKKVQETTKKTLKSKYGENITNVAQIPEVRLKISKTNKEVFSKKTKDELRKITEKARMNIKYISSLEIRIQTILNSLCIEYTANGFLYQYNWDLIFKNKKIIEIQGDFWHANPKFYKESDILLSGLYAKDVWEKDERKRKKAESNGYEVYYLWENDLNKLNDEEVIEKLKEILC